MEGDVGVRAEREKQTAALSSVLAATFLALIKLVVGLLTGSLGIVAEAAHSGFDLVAALVTLFAVRFSDRPPDEQHLYGHGKIENLSALFETLLLLVTCVWIIYEAIQRLFFKAVEVEVSVWAFVVMGGSLVVLIVQSRILYRAARKHHSQALEADALHFSTDIWSTLVVLLGLVLVWLSQRLGPQWAWLANADAVAALAVAVIVIWVSLQLGKRAVAVLLDAVPTGLIEQIAAEASQVPGVRSLGPVRARQAGAFVFVDLTVNVDRSASLEEAHQIAETVNERVRKLVVRGDVVVHVDPVRHSGENLSQTASAIAARLGLRAHDIHAHEVRGRYFVDLHVEVPADLTLEQAHDRVTKLEAAVRGELPQVEGIQTHIEPIAAPTIPITTMSPDEEEALRTQIEAAAKESPGLLGCTGIQVRPSPDGYDVALRCLAEPDLSIVDAHRLTDAAEKRIVAAVPGISQVLIHIEPAGED